MYHLEVTERIFFLFPVCFLYHAFENVRDVRVAYIIAHINLFLHSKQRDLEVDHFSPGRTKWTIETEYDQMVFWCIISEIFSCILVKCQILALLSAILKQTCTRHLVAMAIEMVANSFSFAKCMENNQI